MMSWEPLQGAGGSWGQGAGGAPGGAGLAGGPGADEAFLGLVAEVKQLQRSDREAKEQWVSYVEQMGHGRLDPMKHSAEFLQSYITQYRSGTRLPPPTMVTHSRSGQIQGGGGLEAQIKEAFLQQLGSGGASRAGALAAGGGEEGWHLGEVVNLMQKRSITFKRIWERYCQHFGGGRYDPSKHNKDYHIKFLDFLSEQACVKVSLGAAQAGAGGGMKRGREDSFGLGSFTDDGGAKEHLVLQLQAFQHMGDQHRDLWYRYCDLYLQGIRDPARHDAATLQEFCVNHNVPKVDSTTMSLAIASAAAGGTNLVLGAAGAGQEQMANQVNQWGLLGGGGGGEEKEGLVNQLKAFQRSGPEAYELWSCYADTYLQGVRDPARHDAATLSEFCANHNVAAVVAGGGGGGGGGASLLSAVAS